MTTLFDVALELARVLTNVQESTTTGAGSATTLVDTQRTERNDYWNGGTAFITSGAHAGKSRLVTDHVDTGTTTIDTTTTAVGAGQTYAIIDRDWPRLKLWEFINRAYATIGELPSKDDTLVTVANQEAYTLPAGVYNVVRLEVASSLIAPYNWVPQHGTWEEYNGYVYFKANRWPDAANYPIRLHYLAAPTALSADSGIVNQYVNKYRLVWEAAVEAWNWRIGQSKEDQPTYASRLAQAMINADRFRKQYPIHYPAKAPIYSL